MIPNFLKHFPEEPKKEGEWILKITRLHFNRDDVIKMKTVKCSMRTAYILVRLLALFEDIKTRGRYFGIAWTIEDKKQSFVCGYKDNYEGK